jgi:hypothetical protein
MSVSSETAGLAGRARQGRARRRGRSRRWSVTPPIVACRAVGGSACEASNPFTGCPSPAFRLRRSLTPRAGRLLRASRATVENDLPTGAWHLRSCPSEGRQRPTVSGAHLDNSGEQDGAHASTRRSFSRRNLHGKTKAPPSTKPGALRFRSGLCGCPEHHGRICQVAAQAKPCPDTGGIRRASSSTVAVGPWDLAWLACPVVDVTTTGHRFRWSEVARVVHSWR